MRKELNGKTRTCGLLGNPVEHTLSPLIHNSLAEMKDINMVYVPFLVDIPEIATAVKGAYALNLLGMNATVPFKSDVIPYLMEVDELASDIGAVNTLVRTDGGYKGYNTDMSGLYRAMQSENIILEQADIIILGAGGAARAVAYMCANYGAEHITILNRTLPKAQAIATEINESMKKKGRWVEDCMEAMPLHAYTELPDRRYIVIQSTSVGLHPHIDDVVIEDKKFYEKVSIGFDLIYKPAETKFMKLVKEAGGEAYNGLKMLLYQGVIAFELWNDVKVTEEEAMMVYAKLEEAVRV